MIGHFRLNRSMQSTTAAALLIITAAAAALASSATAAGVTTVTLGTGGSSQKAILSSGRIPVTIAISDRLTVVRQLAATATLTRGAQTTTLGTVTVPLTGGTGSAKISLSAAGRTALAKCAAATVRIAAGSGSSGEPLYVDSAACVRQAPVVDTATATRCDITDPSECLYPFPNNLFTTADSTKVTKLRLNLSIDSTPKTTPNAFAPKPNPIGTTDINRFDGFSPGSMMITHVPGLDSDAALTASGLVRANNIARYADTNQAAVVIDATTGQRWPIWTELDHSTMLEHGYSANSSTLTIRPAKNFTDGHRYIVGLRNLKKADGSAIAPSDGFRLYRDRLVTSSPVVESRRSKMESIFASLKAAGLTRSSLNLAWDFTVASTKSLSERALKMRDNAFAKLGDTTMGDAVIQGSSPVWHIKTVTDTPSDPDTIRQIDGTVDVPCYLTTNYCTTGGTFNFGSDGLPAQRGNNIQHARFRCNIPQSAVDGGGSMYMTTYGHGLFGSMNEVSARNVRQFGNENRMLVCGSDWSGMASEDETTAVSVLGNLTGFPKLADRLQQGYLNFMYLGRVMAHPSGLTTDPAFQVSADGHSAAYNSGTVSYYGNSQGGIAGGGLTALSPDVTRSVLYVGAMNYSLLLPRSVDFDEFKPYLYPNYTKLKERPLLFALLQIMWDRGEPNGYANHITSNPLPNTPTKHVTMEMSYGDHQVANIATEVEARTLNLKVRKPFLDVGRDTTGVISGWGLTDLGAMPLDDNALIVWDIGPYRSPDAPNCKDNSEDTYCGTPSPPLDNVPNRIGTDPHDLNIDSMATLRHQIAEYIKPGGHLIDVCSAGPCYGAGWVGAPK